MRWQRLLLCCTLFLILFGGNCAGAPRSRSVSVAAPLPLAEAGPKAPRLSESAASPYWASTYFPYAAGNGSPASGYPRLAYMWASTNAAAGIGFFGNYDLFMPWNLSDPVAQVSAVRKANPATRILLTLDATYGWPELNPLVAQWWNSKPGDPGYKCLLRDSHGAVLLVAYWGHAMFNMALPYCRQLLVSSNVGGFRSQATPDGAPVYDGIFWDNLHGTISWLGDDIDSDLDGRPDDPAALDSAYRAGVEDFLGQIRSALPSVILVANEADAAYDRWMNGRMFEWQLRDLLNGDPSFTWNNVLDEYRAWARAGHLPRLTFIGTQPEPVYTTKSPFHSGLDLPVAMQVEATASYERMRYGLTTALMGDGLFSFDTRQQDSSVWWYDEFGAPIGESGSTLPPRGYLGLPTGEPRLLIDRLDTPNQVANGAFQNGLAGWRWWVNKGAGAAATIDIQPEGGIAGTAAAHIALTKAGAPWDVQLQQGRKTTVAGATYTLSFWARSEVTRTLSARIAQEPAPGTDYGFGVNTVVTPEWQHFHLWDSANVTANDGEIEFHFGGEPGELWLSDVELQAGALGVWARPFQYGLVVINSTRSRQWAPLPGAYCKLKGDQAPLFQARVDDDQATASAGWSTLDASVDQFGMSVKVAAPGQGDSVTYTPLLAYAGVYEVLAWVAPNATLSSAVSVSVRHADGESRVLLDETSGEIGWHTIGTYTFNAGDAGSATLAATGDGTVVADAFKWVSAARYNDGSRVQSIVLQPQDGVILLSSCSVAK